MRRDEALRALDEVAAEQAGLVTSAQATARGVSRMAQRRLAEVGLLENVGRGVYRLVGAPPPSHLEMRVAWLRLDPATPAWQRDGRGPGDGVVSHRSACLLHDLGDIPAPRIELTVPRRRTTREPGVRLHTGHLEPADVTFVDGLPVTTAEKTIVDLLESRADGAHVGGVIADAERRRLIDPQSLARKAAGFSRQYGLPRTTGADLLASLAEQAGQRLSTTDVQQAMLAGVLAGSGVSDAIHKMVASSNNSLLPLDNEKLLAAVAQTVVPSNERLLAALAYAAMPNIQVLSAQAVATILNNPALTQQIQAMRAPIAELAAQAMRTTGTAATGRRAIAAAVADANGSQDRDDEE